MQRPNWTQISLVKMSWKTNVPLDENLVGKALSISNYSVPGCLGWGNVQRHQNAFHRTEEACPVAALTRKLSQNKAQKEVITPVPQSTPHPFPNPVSNPLPQFIPPPLPQTTYTQGHLYATTTADLCSVPPTPNHGTDQTLIFVMGIHKWNCFHVYH